MNVPCLMSHPVHLVNPVQVSFSQSSAEAKTIGQDGRDGRDGRI